MHLIKHFKFCSEEIKCQLFKSFCTTFYCCHLWSNCSAESRRRLKVAHNRIFRVLMKLEHRISMSYTYLCFNIMHSSIVIRKAMNGFINRIYLSENVLIDTIVKSDHFTCSAMFQYWSNFLYVT